MILTRSSVCEMVGTGMLFIWTLFVTGWNCAARMVEGGVMVVELGVMLKGWLSIQYQEKSERRKSGVIVAQLYLPPGSLALFPLSRTQESRAAPQQNFLSPLYLGVD